MFNVPKEKKKKKSSKKKERKKITKKIRQIARSFDIALSKATLGPKIINLLLSSNEKPLKNSLKYHKMMLDVNFTNFSAKRKGLLNTQVG